MSLSCCISTSPLERMMRMYSCFSVGAGSSMSSSENPMMAFSGVRSSWLMLARKSDFMRSDSSARTRAFSSSRWVRFWAEMSLTVSTTRGCPATVRKLPATLTSQSTVAVRSSEV